LTAQQPAFQMACLHGVHSLPLPDVAALNITNARGSTCVARSATLQADAVPGQLEKVGGAPPAALSASASIRDSSRELCLLLKSSTSGIQWEMTP
jgi:hypothetical protein